MVLAAGVDLQPRGLLLGLSAGDGAMVVDAAEAGICGESLLVVRNGADRGLVPTFASVADCLGEEREIDLEGGAAARPHVTIRRVLARVSDAVRAGWGDTGALGLVVSAYAKDPHRDALVKLAQQLGWRRAEVVNRTTATAVSALQARPHGDYLVLALAYDSAEAAVVRWGDGELRTLTRQVDSRVSASEVDRCLVQMIFHEMYGAGSDPETALDVGPEGWFWLRRRAEMVRSRLDYARRVAVEISQSLFPGAAEEVVLERQAFLEQMNVPLDRLRQLLGGCCDTAGIPRTHLKGCLAVGTLLRHSPVFLTLRAFLGPVALIPVPLETPCIGAARLAAHAVEEGLGKPVIDAPTTGRGDPSDELRVPLERSSASVDTFIDRARKLAASGKRAEAEAVFRAVKEYVRILELSFEDPIDALRVLSGEAIGEPSREVADRGPSPTTARDEPPQSEPKAQAVSEGDEPPRARQSPRAQLRQYVAARELIVDAETALKEGWSERAIGFAHLALKRSKDPRILRAAGEVHVRAVRKRKPTVQGFSEERMWLLCALGDDPTSKSVQQAVTERYVIHAEQLMELGTGAARSEAEEALQELGRYVGLSGRSQELTEKLGRTP
jgi:hypothetical protein